MFLNKHRDKSDRSGFKQSHNGLMFGFRHSAKTPDHTQARSNKRCIFRVFEVSARAAHRELPCANTEQSL